MKITLLSLASLATSVFGTQQFCTPSVVSSWQQQEIFTQAIHQFYVKKNISKAFESIQENYIQHNPFVGQGAQTALGFLSTLIPTLDITIYHLGFDSGTGYVHFKAKGPPSSIFANATAIVDIYRMNGSCIIEHWDVIQTVPANATNPLGMF